MALGTTFGSIHSNTDLRLIQQTVEITPAAPRLNIVDIPGSPNGSKDLTEALGVGVTYQDGGIKWTFALYPGADWAAARRQVGNALNGHARHIILDQDPGWYYDGRPAVTEYKTDGPLRQIVVEAACRPYKRKLEASSATAAITTEDTELAVNIGDMPQVPEITTDVQATITWGGVTVTATPGAHRFPALFMKGQQVLTVKGSEAGNITITWREGALV